MKLFRVTLHGCYSAIGRSFHENYVVADDPTTAYEKVRKYLDEKDYYFTRDRILDVIELLADSDQGSQVEHPLFL